MNDHALQVTPEQLVKRIEELEARLSRLESGAAIAGRSTRERVSDDTAEEMPELDFSSASIESNFGEFGLAWLGNLVLLFGIIFFVQYLQRAGMPVLSSLFGYAAVAGLFLVGRSLRNSQTSMASIFRLSGYILLFIVTLFLHFLVGKPVIASPVIAIILLVGVTAVLFYMSIRKQSQGLASLAMIMGLATAILSDSTHVMLPLSFLLSLLAVIFMQRFGWWRLLIFSIFVVYLANLIWFLGNPIMGHPLQALKVHEFGFIYLFLIAAAYSMVALMPRKGSFPDNGAISAVIINGAGFSFLITCYVLTFFKDSYVPLFVSVAVFCFIYSIILQKESSWKVTASLYALYSFVALSVTVFGIFGFPRAYFLLAIQSLLVVSMALWFRSKVIVVLNTFLFLILLIVYLSTAHSVNSANISFALVALVTARTLNWQKQRLNIKTEMLRNTYLLTGFIMVLYALYRAVPGNYVTLSWSLAAVLYFVLSILIKNLKYRYLALATMAATALYLFIVDLSRVEILYRVAAFLFLALISILLSLYYTKRRAARKADPDISQ